MRRNLRKWGVIGLGASLVLSNFAAIATPLVVNAAPAEDRVVSLVGDLQDEIGCAADWSPTCEESVLQPTEVDGVWAADFEVPGGTWAYKVAFDQDWPDAFPGGDSNVPLVLEGPANLRFVYSEVDGSQKLGIIPLDLAGAATEADAALINEPVRQAGSDENFYFVLTDRFANGDTSNDTGGIDGTRLDHGFDNTDKGFYHGGDIAGLRNNLDYIAGLGTSAIWLTPSFKNQPVQGEGVDASSGYHGYWITDFTQIDPHLGSNEELEALISEAHDLDMKVYFDIIVNHTADVIYYEEGVYDYISQAEHPYRDAEGNVFNPTDLARSGATWPALDPATSFPYTPLVEPGKEDLKVPAWLNDVTLYHNRGDSTWAGESDTYGDFQGLDDIMTEHPTVVQGFIDVYQDWIDLGIDGFRIDTAKHVNFEFWEEWTTAILEHAHANGKDEFFMFGEVYSSDQKFLSPYVRNSDMNSVLDFAFQDSAAGYAGGNSAQVLSGLFAGDDYFTTADSSASALPTFLGNHDMGRIGYFLNSTSAPLERSELAHSLMYLTRGQPVVYYGDEQGFAGTGGDKDSRQSLFASEVVEYQNQNLLTGEQAGSVDRFDTDAPLYQHIADVAELRDSHPALKSGAQIERFAESGPGIYAFSRVDRDEKIEYLVATNNTDAALTATVPSLTNDGVFTGIFGAADSLTANADGAVEVTVPALSAVVYRADRTVSAPAEAGEITLSLPNAGAGLDGLAAVAVETADVWQETSFAWRVVGDDEWTALGTAESTTPRVFHDVTGLTRGTLLEYRAVSVDAAGNIAAASTFASVGNSVALEDVEAPEVPINMVSAPGSHNAAMGCPGDWQPGCEAARLLWDEALNLYVGTFDLPAGDYEYKIAINGSWDLNYGVGAVVDGSNQAYTHDGGELTIYWDPLSKLFHNTALGPIITLPGGFQSQVGCSADWQPGCFSTLMTLNEDTGLYEWTTDALAAGSYEVKVAHGFGWGVNYGVGGVLDGANYVFSVAANKLTTFTYDPESHLLEIESADPPLPGTGQLQAHWIDANTIAWPAGLIRGANAADLTWSLESSATADLALVEGVLEGSDESIALTYLPSGLTAAQLEAKPALAGYAALSVGDLTREQVTQLLTTQLHVLARNSEDEPVGFSGVQLPGVLDDLYAADLADAELGAVFVEGAPQFRLWAPTAQSARLLLWDNADDPTVVDPVFDEASGVWTATPEANAAGAQYLWEVEVYAHSTRAIETNQVTDPYSVALTVNSTRSIAVDLSDEQWAPEIWTDTQTPVVERQVDRAIYELHVRDFSIGDVTVPEDLRGTYRAFTVDSAGTAQLRELAEAGINTVHLLPTFDIATIEEDRSLQAVPACDLEALTASTAEGEGPAGTAQQACIEAIKDLDGFNWGYDPFHFQAPEGSYAVDPDGGERVAEFREMVGALHSYGLQVVLDKVYNHTTQSGQGEKSVLDQVVPGYYHRLNAVGGVETSTCCENVATEHAAAEKLMVDSVVLWARDYKVDGFRFDLMGHHSKENMLNVRAALDELTLEEHGVDGSAIFLYGEGWDFGEVQGGRLFEQASQGNLDGTGIATFSDRLRDAVHGGSPVDGSSKFTQGYGTGLATAPNSRESRSEAAQYGDLAHQTDLVRLGLAGNLRDYEFLTSSGEVARGEELDYRGAPAGYASHPEEVISYVDAHDNETLFDLAVFKLDANTSIEDRTRMNTLMLATATLSQTPSFWHAGTELLRSKSLDRDSYNSGDWFNRIDWTGQESTFGSGLPPREKNQEHWTAMAELLNNSAIKPQAENIAAAEAAALDLLRLRSSVDLFRLGDPALIQEKLSFPNSGPDADPGIIVMSIDDTVGERTDDTYSGALVVFNASPQDTTQVVTELEGRNYKLAAIQAEGADPVVAESFWNYQTAEASVPARTVAVFLEIDGDTEFPEIPVTPVDPVDPDPVDPKPGTKFAQVVPTPDLSGDGIADVLAVDHDGVLWLYRGKANGGLSVASKVGSGWGELTISAPGDFNSDGRADILAKAANGDLFFYAGNGKGGFAKAVKAGWAWGPYDIIPAGDVTGDGIPDVLAIDKAGVLYYYAGNGKGGFTGKLTRNGQGWTNVDLYPAGDLNGDGNADILSIRADGTLHTHLGRGDGGFSKSTQTGQGWAGYELFAGSDANGDGLADLYSRDSANRLWFYAGKPGGFRTAVQVGVGW